MVIRSVALLYFISAPVGSFGEAKIILEVLAAAVAIVIPAFPFPSTIKVSAVES